MTDNESGFNPVSRWLFFSYSIISLVIGSLGNILFLATLSHKNDHQRRVTTRATCSSNSEVSNRHTFYQRTPSSIQSVADYALYTLTTCEMMSLWFITPRFVLNLGLGYDVVAISDKFCATYIYSGNIIINMYVAILCIFTTQRTLSIRWPLMASQWLSCTRITWCAILALLFILLKQLPVFFIAKLYSTTLNDTFRCELEWGRGVNRSTFKDAYFTTEMVTHSMIGYPLLIVITVLLNVTLRKQTRELGRKNGRVNYCEKNHSHINLQGRRRKKMYAAQMLIALSTVQVTITLPYFVMVQLSKKVHFSPVFDRHRLWIFYACALPSISNSAFSYYLFLIVSGQFRQRSKAFLRSFLSADKNQSPPSHCALIFADKPSVGSPILITDQ